MVSVSTVNGDASSVSDLLSQYSSSISGLSGSWKGTSSDSIISKAESFASEYQAIVTQMESFANAVSEYEKYKNLKDLIKQTEVDRANASDENKASFDSPLADMRDDLEIYKSNIESYLSSASSPSLDAAGTSGSSGSSSSGDSSTASYGNLDMENYPKGDSREDGVERAVLVAKYLMENGGFTKEQAAAIVGVYIDENNCDPGEVMQAEKDGYGVEGTGGNGYGAGIASWTFEESKRQALEDAGIDPNTPIENLSLQQQCDVIIAQSQKSESQYYDALKRCDTIEDASATAVIITGGVGFSDNWDTHPTAEEAKELSDFYGASNDRNFGESEYHWNLDVRRLDYAKEVYDRL